MQAAELKRTDDTYISFSMVKETDGSHTRRLMIPVTNIQCEPPTAPCPRAGTLNPRKDRYTPTKGYSVKQEKNILLTPVGSKQRS